MDRLALSPAGHWDAQARLSAGTYLCAWSRHGESSDEALAGEFEFF